MTVIQRRKVSKAERLVGVKNRGSLASVETERDLWVSKKGRGL